MHRRAKPVVFALAAAPFVWLAVRAWTGRLSVNPIEDITLTTGIWALRFLVITIALTPLRRVSGWNSLVQYRRMLGLFAFFYATLHVATYVVLDLFFAWDLILADVAKRPFITMGALAFASMLPLALTSTRGWIRRLGRRWQLLHRLVYLSAIAAAVHYLWKVKVIAGSPVYYAAIVAGLLLFRVGWAVVQGRRARRPVPSRAFGTPRAGQ